MKITRNFFISLFSGVLIALSAIGCSDHESYSDGLNKETKSINAFLADQRVVGSVPADSVFEVGKDAPYYRMDEDGSVYMQVINRGDMNNRAKADDLVYFRFMRYNLHTYAATGELEKELNNSENVNNNASFRYLNFHTSSSSAWGQALQMPLNYLGYGCEVNIVVRSAYGLTDEIASVIPYLYNVRYYKSKI